MKRDRYWSYGSTASVSGPRKSLFQIADERHQHRQVLLERRACGSARPSRGSRRACRGSCRGRSRPSATGRSPTSTSSARRPSPRTRTCCRCRCRTLATSAAFVETATKCLATAASSPPSAVEQPLARGVRVGERLERRERLGGDDEERLLRVEVARRLGEVGAVDVGDEARDDRRAARSARARAYAIAGPRSEPPMPMLTTAADRLAGVALPLAASGPRSQNAAIRSSTACTSGTTFSPSTSIDRVARRPQRDVQHRALLGDVDLVAAEHRLARSATPACLGQREQQPQRLVGDAAAWSSRGTGPRPRPPAARRGRRPRRTARAGPARPARRDGAPARPRSAPSWRRSRSRCSQSVLPLRR